MLSITAIMLGATLGTTTPGGWSFGLHAGPFDPSISNDGAIRDYYDLPLPALKTITSTKIARCL